MKKFTALILMSALLLTACTNNERQEGSDTTGSSTSSADSENSSTPNSTSTPSSSSSATPDNSTSGDNSDSEGSFETEAPDSFIAPDGSTVYFSEGSVYEYSYVLFDLAFVRWSEPIFESSLDDPSVLDKTDSIPIENPEYFRVKAGDVLQIGDQRMTVKEASCTADTYGNIIGQHMILDGELVLEGIVEIGDGENLFFFIDSTVNAYPVVYSEYPDVIGPQLHNTKEFQIICDDGQISLPDSFNHFDLSDINKLSFTKAKITVKDIKISHYENKTNYGITVAELVSVEEIKD